MSRTTVELPPIDSELATLVDALCEGAITPDDRDRLEAILAGDRNAKLYYVAYLDLHAQVQWLTRGEDKWPAGEAAPMACDSDAESARHGDDGAFGELVQRTHADTYALARRLVSNDDDALDVVQDAYLRAYRSLSKFRGDAQFTTWMYRITANCASTYLGRRRRHQHGDLGEIAEVADPRPENDPAAAADSSTLRDRLEEAVQIVTALWGGEPVDFEGEHYRVTDLVGHPRPHSPGGPPLIIAGGSPRMLRFAGEHADINLITALPRATAAGTWGLMVDSSRGTSLHCFTSTATVLVPSKGVRPARH